MPPDYQVFILDNNQNRITEVKNFVHTNLSGNTYHKGNILQLTKVLSSYGTLKVRLAHSDPMFAQFAAKYPNLIEPWQFGIEVVHQGGTIFKGIIIDNAPFNRQYYVDVHAVGYLYRLERLLVKRDATASPPTGTENYRTFTSGTMAAAIQAIITERQADVPAGDILKKITMGSVVNPNFPASFTKADGVTPLTGPWNFSGQVLGPGDYSGDMVIQVDYKSILYVIQAMAVYAQCDFQLTDALVFNFSPSFGVDRSKNLVFTFGPQGQIFDYNVPLQGQRQANSIWGIATDPVGNTLHVNNPDTNSINANQVLLEEVMGFTDVQDQNTLTSRTAQEQGLVTNPTSTINVYMNRKAYPFSAYDVGDLVTIIINDGLVQVNQVRRITAISIDVRDTGQEFITLETNPPLPGQV